MRVILAGLIFLSLSCFLVTNALAEEAFDPSSVAHPAILALPMAPADRPEIASIKMIVTTDSELAQRHVRIGLNHLLGFWDLEAYRHFLIAVREDPNCPMAYWGICVSLSSPGPTYTAQRVAAFKRLRSLIEAGRGNGLENQLAGALAALYSEGPRKAGTLFSLTAERYKDAVLPAILSCMTLRDGYDDFGEAREGQKIADKFLAELVERHPECPAVRFYQAAILEGAPNPADGLKSAEALQEFAASYPPYNEILGYFRFRNGDYRGAAEAYQAAFDQYSSYFEKHQIPSSFTPSIHRCREWLATSRMLSGNSEAAFKLADEASAITFDQEEMHHPGAAFLLWRGRTLRARLHLAREEFEEASQALPGPREKSEFDDLSIAPLVWQHLRQYAEGRQMAKKGEIQRALRFVTSLEKFTRVLAAAQGAETRRGSLSEWMHWSELILRLRDELRAGISIARGGDDLDSARIWLKAAADKCLPPEMTSPPLLARPPEASLVEIERQKNDPEALDKARHSGLKRWPKHPSLLESPNH